MVCAAGTKRETTAARPSIAGGFVLISVASLMTAWRACRSAPLGIADFRAWLACREMAARRCLAEEARAPAYSFEELAGLLGIARKRARASVNRLVDAGLLHWSDRAIAFLEPSADFDPGLDDSIGRGKGSLAIPRRMLRLLAAGARAALIATVLGILLRCLSRRRRGFDGRGRVKSTWIARTFGVDLRRVKQARRELVELGWIDPEPSGPRLEKRWGRAFRIDLGWDRPGPVQGRALPPVPRPERPEIATPPTDQEPFQERNQDQEPGSAGPAGIRLAKTGGEGELPVAITAPTATEPVITRSSPPAAMASKPAPSPAASSGTPLGPGTASPTAGPAPLPAPSPAVMGPGPAEGDLPAPRLADVRVEDLKDTGRLLELHGQAVARGLVRASEGDRLRVVSAAEHALAIGEGNPAGLFCYLIRGGLWRYVTQADEDRANIRIKAHLRGPEPARVAGSGPGRARAPSLSADAIVVGEVRAAVMRRGILRDPFGEFARLNPGWTRERWDRALMELEGPDDDGLDDRWFSRPRSPGW
jgi:hypothetical protein